MRNYKLPILYFICLACGCKPASVAFDYNKTVNKNFFSKLTGILVDEKGVIDSVKVYEAVLKERFVERDATTDFKLLNTESKQAVVDFKIERDSNKLYLMEVFATPSQDNMMVYLSTGYGTRGICTHVGPAYLGSRRKNNITVSHELKIKHKKDIFWLVPQSNKKMKILCDTIPKVNDVNTMIRIKQIILNEANKIGGNKPLLFTTERIFNDTNALAFRYLQTIK